jgi:hypothetical protein
LHLSDVIEFEISAPHCPTHFSSSENGDVLDIVVHKNFRLSGVIISDVLGSDHLAAVFHILDHVKTKKISEPIEKLTDGERFQSLVSG